MIAVSTFLFALGCSSTLVAGRPSGPSKRMPGRGERSNGEMKRAAPKFEVLAGGPVNDISVWTGNLVQCESVDISWSNAVLPVNLAIGTGGYYVGTSWLTTQYHLFTNSSSWVVTAPSGTDMIFQVTDANGDFNYVQNLQVGQSDDSSCLNNQTDIASASSSSSSSSSPTSTSATSSTSTDNSTPSADGSDGGSSTSTGGGSTTKSSSSRSSSTTSATSSTSMPSASGMNTTTSTTSTSTGSITAAALAGGSAHSTASASSTSKSSAPSPSGSGVSGGAGHGFKLPRFTIVAALTVAGAAFGVLL